MTRRTALKHEFVEYIPEDVADGTVYISIPYATAVHRCCCGCGGEVVTPLSPTDWTLAFDGKTISLDPSIGNWSFPCQSHYWIRNNVVRWDRQWSTEEIQLGRTTDRHAKQEYFQLESSTAELQRAAPAPTRTFLERLKRFWSW